MPQLRPYRHGNKRQKHIYSADEIDYFALYSSVTDEVYLLPIEKAPTKKFSLRYKEPYNAKSNKAEDFLITKMLGIE